MAKRRNLKDTLRKERQTKIEEETILATKVVLPKANKDITKIAEQADTIHQEEAKEPLVANTPPPLPQKIIKKVAKKAAVVSEVIPKERVTVWLPKPLLKTLKIHLATEEKKITEYFTALVKKDLKIK